MKYKFKHRFLKLDPNKFLRKHVKLKIANEIEQIYQQIIENNFKKFERKFQNL